MAWKGKAYGGVLGLIGFLLSPLSWWNDAIINLPLALAFGWLIAAVYKPAFEPAVVVGYWLTNIIGLVLLHKGISKAVAKKQSRYTRRDFIRDLVISLAYTLVIVVLFRLKVLQRLSHYFVND